MGRARVPDPYVGRAQKLEVEEGGVSKSVWGQSECEERGEECVKEELGVIVRG